MCFAYVWRAAPQSLSNIFAKQRISIFTITTKQYGQKIIRISGIDTGIICNLVLAGMDLRLTQVSLELYRVENIIYRQKTLALSLY